MNTSDARSRLPSYEWRWTYAAIVVIVAASWLFSLKTFLSPVIAFVVLLSLLRPYKGTQRHRNIVIAASGMMVLWLFKSLGSILAPFIVAIVIAYILHPVVDSLEKRGVKRGLAVAILMVPILSAIVLVLAFGAPAIAVQVESLVTRVPEAVQRLIASLETVRVRLAASSIPYLSGDRFTSQLQIDETKIATFLQEQRAEIVSRAWAAVLGVGRGLSFLVTIIGYLVLTPVLIIYLLKDYHGAMARMRELIPVRQRARWLTFLHEFDHLLSRFLRGQLVAAMIVGVLTWLGLMALGVPYSGLVGTVAGVFNLIPYLGLVVSVVPILIIAILSGDFVSIILRSGIVFFIVQLIDGTITGPRIVGGSIGLHPVAVILALAVGSFYFGFVGLLLAMPAAILVKLFVRDAVVRYKGSKLYLGEPTERPE